MLKGVFRQLFVPLNASSVPQIPLDLKKIVWFGQVLYGLFCFNSTGASQTGPSCASAYVAALPFLWALSGQKAATMGESMKIDGVIIPVQKRSVDGGCFLSVVSSECLDTS